MPAESYRSSARAESDAPSVGSLVSTHEPPAFGAGTVRALAASAGAIGGLFAWSDSAPLTGAGAVAIMALLAGWRLRQRSTAVELYEKGLVVTRRGGRSTIAFEDVNEVWFEIDRVPSRGGAAVGALRLVSFEGAVHRIPLDVSASGAIGGAVLRACAEPLLVDAGDALREGEALRFGSIQVDRQAVSRGGDRLAWSEVEIVVIARGNVSFYRGLPVAAALTVRLDEIPNPTVFLGVVTACARHVRTDDRLFIPFATAGEGAVARAAARSRMPVRERLDSVLRELLVGGGLVVAGLAVMGIIRGEQNLGFLVAWVLMVMGGIRILRSLVISFFDRD